MSAADPKGSPSEHLKPHLWKKGQSGNPGGRPKGSVAEKYFMAEHERCVLERLHKALAMIREDDSRRAQQELEDYMDGKGNYAFMEWPFRDTPPNDALKYAAAPEVKNITLSPPLDWLPRPVGPHRRSSRFRRG